MNPLASINAANYVTQHAGISQSKFDEYSAGHDHIAKGVAALMTSGHPVDSEEVQQLIGKHYAYVCQFWTPNRIAYKSLALTYTMDPAFKSTYEAYEVGLAVFIQKSIYLWADQNLNDAPIASN